MNLALRVCALLATVVAVLGLTGRLTAKPPDLPVNDPPVLTPEDGSEEASPPRAGGAIRYSPQPASEDPTEIMLSPLTVDLEVIETANKTLANQTSPPSVAWTADSSGSEAPEMARKLLVLRQPWRNPEYIKEHPPKPKRDDSPFFCNFRQANIDLLGFYTTGTCEQLEELTGGKQLAQNGNAAAANRVPIYLLVLKQPWRGSVEVVNAEGKNTSAPSKKAVAKRDSAKKAPCAPPKPADKDGFTCPYLKQQAADRHAAMFADPEVSEDVLGNLDKLEAAQSLIEAADKLQHAGRRAEALHCLSLVQKLCPGSRCALEAADKAARIAKGQKSQSGSNEAADVGEARPQAKGCSSSKPCCCTKKRKAEAPKVAIQEIIFRGNTFASSHRLSRIIKSSVKVAGQPETGILDPQQVEADTGELWQYYRKFGFLDAEVESHIDQAPDSESIHLIFHVNEGNRYRVSKAPEIVGDIRACPREQLEAYTTVKPGSYYSKNAIQLDKKKIEAWYGYRGQKVQMDHYQVFDKEKPGVVFVQYQIQERPMDKVGEIRVAGCRRTRTDASETRQACQHEAQASHDLKKAEFYDRTGHTGAAYFQYEIVRRRYAGTPQAEQAAKRIQDLYAPAAKATKLAGGECKPQEQTPPEPGVEEIVRGLMKACRLAAADHRQEQAVELARQAQALDPRSVLADPLVYRLAQLAGKPQKKELASGEESSCPACPPCTAVQVVKPMMPCCPCIDGGIVQAFEQLMEEAERATGQSGAEQAEAPDHAKEPASSSTCPAEQHQAGSEEKSEMQGGMLSCVQQWLNGQEHGTLMFGVGMDEQLHCFMKCNLTLGDQVYHLVLGRGCPVLWTTPNAAVAAKKPSQ
jgi:hypothetical protein